MMGDPDDGVHDMLEYMSMDTGDTSTGSSMVQSPLGPPSSFKKSKWTPEEDSLLIDSVKLHGFGNWSLVAQTIPGRSGKQCRERWINQLCPALSRDNWTPQEDTILIQQQRLHGNVWSKIAQYLPGRSPNNVKNRWSWLSRHRVSPALAAQMMNFVVQPPEMAARRPPMPQIFQTQQTPPGPELQWQVPAQTFTGTRKDRMNFSDPLEPLTEGQLYPSRSAGAEMQFDFSSFHEDTATPPPPPVTFSFPEMDQNDDFRQYDDWIPF
jgi:hypothetical protein